MKVKMSPSKLGKNPGKGKGPRKRKNPETVNPSDDKVPETEKTTQDKDPAGAPKKMKVKFNFPERKQRVIFDRFLIFDIGLKISETRNYQPIKEVRY